MSTKTKTIFFKYFTNIFAIMVLFVIIINILVTAFMIHFAVTRENSHRELVKNQIDSLISSLSYDCARLFAIINNDTTKFQIDQSNLATMNDADKFNIINPLRTRLSDNIVDNSYIDSVHLYSSSKKWAISNKNFVSDENLSQNIWLYDDLQKDCLENKLWTRLIQEKSSKNNYIAIYQNLDFNASPNFISVIILDVANLKGAISKITRSEGSFLVLKNNANDEILLSVGNISVPHNILKSDSAEENSILLDKYSSYSTVFMEHNWSYTYTYNNRIVMNNIFRIIGILALFSVILLIISAFIAYNRAERIYKPLKSIVTVMDAPRNQLYAKNLAEEYQYSEIKFILENLFSIIKENSEIKSKLEENLSLLTDANKYAAEVQIQSHFIFNTLEIIYLEAYKLFGDDNIISEMVCNLSDLIRLSFKNDNKLITIKDELEYAQKYIYIQSIRFENCFDVSWDVDEALHELYCPKLILQPIIENAINHGIIPAKRHCNINIRIRKLDHRIIFTVEDSGVGMTPQKVRDIEALLKQTNIIPKKNIGISNVNLRIKLMFGEDYGVKLVSSNLEEGTKIEISIPVIVPEE